MANLADLPTEIFLSICLALDDFDDVARLRRCCRRFQEIISVPGHCNSIIAAILPNVDAAAYFTAAAIEALAKQIPKFNGDLAAVILRWQSLKALQQSDRIPDQFDADYEALVSKLKYDNTSYGGQSLRWAASQGITPLVQMLINEIEDVNSIVPLGEAPLGVAATNGHTRVVRLLLDKGAHTESRAAFTLMTPLARGIANGHADIVDMLLERGANIEATDRDGKTPLCLAVEQGNPMLVKGLLEKGAQVKARIHNGKTPLHLAAWYRNEQALSLLLDWCLAQNCPNLLECCDMELEATPLHDICRAGCNVSFVRRLLAEGVSACTFDTAGESPLTRVLHNISLYPETDDDDETPYREADNEDEDELFEKVRLLSQDQSVVLTPTKRTQRTSLHIAAERSDPRLMMWLLEHGGRSGLNQPDASGNTPLMTALAHNHQKVVESLLNTPNIELSCQNRSGETTLHVAARKCTPLELSSLLRLNAALLDAVDGEGRTPLLVAFRAHRLDNCEYLLNHKADACIADNFGQDPLRWIAEETWETGALELLLDHGLVSLDRQGNTLLHKAVQGLSIQRVVDVLKSPHIQLHDKNAFGDTALHTAVQNANHERTEEMVELLLGSDNESTLASIPNNSGKTALDFALERAREGTIKILVHPKWNVKVGLEWDPESVWIQKWSSQPWYSDLLRIIDAARPYLRAENQLLIDQCGGLPLTVSRNDSQEFRWLQSGGAQPYLSIQIPGDRPSPVRRLIFTMVSHDQGWSDRHPVNLRNEGSYCGSRTWFEVGVSKASTDHRGLAPREIQRNIHTSDQSRKHTVIWDVRDGTPGLKEWLSGLEGGDVLHVYPKAYQYGWRNCVQGVVITVFYERS